MNTSVNERIRSIIKRENLTIESFANNIDISKNTLVSMFNKGTKPSYEILSSIAIAYPDYPLRWILLGKGNMLKNEDEQFTEATNKIIEANERKIKRLEDENASLMRSHEELFAIIKDLKAQIKELTDLENNSK